MKTRAPTITPPLVEGPPESGPSLPAKAPSTKECPAPPPTLPPPEPAMYESEEFERLEEYLSQDHPPTCGCRDCDPDFYFDPAERDAGRPDPERWSCED